MALLGTPGTPGTINGAPPYKEATKAAYDQYGNKISIPISQQYDRWEPKTYAGTNYAFESAPPQQGSTGGYGGPTSQITSTTIGGGVYPTATGTAAASDPRSPTTPLYGTLPGSGSGSGTLSNGITTLSPGAYEQQQQSQLEFLLNDQAFKSRLNALGSQAGTNGPMARESYDSGGQESAARAAAFARAKEMTGQNALAGLRTVQDVMSQRGLTGSTGPGLEGGNIADVIQGASGSINEFTREQLIQDLNRSAQVADTTYQGNIAQRGQDLQRQQALIALINSGRLY